MKITMQQINSVPEKYRTMVYLDWLTECQRDYVRILEKLKPLSIERAKFSGMMSGLGAKGESNEEIMNHLKSMAATELLNDYPLCFVEPFYVPEKERAIPQLIEYKSVRKRSMKWIRKFIMWLNCCVEVHYPSSKYAAKGS